MPVAAALIKFLTSAADMPEDSEGVDPLDVIAGVADAVAAKLKVPAEVSVIVTLLPATKFILPVL